MAKRKLPKIITAREATAMLHAADDGTDIGLRNALVLSLLYRAGLRIQGRLLDHVVGMEQPMAAEIGQSLGTAADAITIIPDPALSMALIERLRAAPPAPALPDSGRRFVAVVDFDAAAIQGSNSLINVDFAPCNIEAFVFRGSIDVVDDHAA